MKPEDVIHINSPTRSLQKLAFYMSESCMVSWEKNYKASSDRIIGGGLLLSEPQTHSMFQTTNCTKTGTGTIQAKDDTPSVQLAVNFPIIIYMDATACSKHRRDLQLIGK